MLDGLPCPGGDWKSVFEQLKVVQDLDLPPDIIINLKVQMWVMLFTVSMLYRHVANMINLTTFVSLHMQYLNW